MPATGWSGIKGRLEFDPKKGEYFIKAEFRLEKCNDAGERVKLEEMVPFIEDYVLKNLEKTDPAFKGSTLVRDNTTYDVARVKDEFVKRIPALTMIMNPCRVVISWRIKPPVAKTTPIAA